MGDHQEESTRFWHKVLVEGEKPVRIMRTLFRTLPASPRCKICLVPFAGVGGRILRVTGEFAPSRKNPRFCNG